MKIIAVAKAIEFIDTMSDKDFEKLINGEYEFSLRPTKVTVKTETNEQRDNVYEKYVKAIYSSNTRDEVKEFISELGLTKDKLITLAKYMSVHADKKSKKEDIVNRIVDSIIGGEFRREVFGDKG